MLRIKFQYKDEMSEWKWRKQQCTMESIEECIKVYGLNEPDVTYEILSVEEV